MIMLMLVTARGFLRVVTVPKSILIPVVLVFCMIGAFALNNIISDVWVLLIFGLIGYGLVKFRFPLAPLILGLILGDQIEVNLVRALMTDNNPWLFLTRPISGGLLGLSIASVVFAIWQHKYSQKRVTQSDEPDVDF
jgi:putative tricarboxylic transport membrane protein